MRTHTQARGSYLSHQMGEAGLCWVSDVLTLSSIGDTSFSSNNCKEKLWFSYLFKNRTYSVDIPNISFLLNPLLALDSFICCRLWHLQAL